MTFENTGKKQHPSAAAKMQFHLATAWLNKGKVDRAVEGFRSVVHIDPNHGEAWSKLAGLMFEQGRLDEALECYDKAVALDPDDIQILAMRDMVRIQSDLVDRYRKSPQSVKQYFHDFSFQDHPDGKLNLAKQYILTFHRSGWWYGIDALSPLHNSRGILFDGQLEYHFMTQHWKVRQNPPDVLERMKREGAFEILATSEERGIVPYKEPWVGVIHLPHEVPADHYFHASSTRYMFAKEIWKKSLDQCIGLFTLSQYHADWIREQTGKPTSALILPTEIPEATFDFDRFLANPERKIVQIGFWLRSPYAVYRLPIPGYNPLKYKKVRILASRKSNKWIYQQQKRLFEKEKRDLERTTDPLHTANTIEVDPLPDSEYDALLSENIVFMYLYDAIANNTVVECIARATPLLINPLPSVVEYLGKDYPFYYENYSEAAKKALDVDLIRETHLYLKDWKVRKKLSGDYFLKSVRESEVYQSIRL